MAPSPKVLGTGLPRGLGALACQVLSCDPSLPVGGGKGSNCCPGHSCAPTRPPSSVGFASSIHPDRGLFPRLQTPEEERGLLHGDSNGYTNLPDVVQPSHSPTEAKSSSASSPAKDTATDVSSREGGRQAGRAGQSLDLGWRAALPHGLAAVQSWHLPPSLPCVLSERGARGGGSAGLGQGLWGGGAGAASHVFKERQRSGSSGWHSSPVFSSLLLCPPLQYQSRGLVKAPGKSSFTMFVDLGIYQSSPGGGDTIPITGE